MPKVLVDGLELQNQAMKDEKWLVWCFGWWEVGPDSHGQVPGAKKLKKEMIFFFCFRGCMVAYAMRAAMPQNPTEEC